MRSTVPFLCFRCFMILIWGAMMYSVLYFPKFFTKEYEDHTLYLFAWGDILEPSILSDFEKETGIKIQLNYYSSNEELLAKFRATQGFGYDLVIPSDYAVRLLIEGDLLQEINWKKLPFRNQLNPLLMRQNFDPENRFSIPFAWEFFALGIDRIHFATQKTLHEPSWRWVFDQKLIDYKISMVNDPNEAVLFASFYLYGPSQHLSFAQVLGVKNLLKQQKQWVEAYANFRGDYFLATKNCPVVIASSSYLLRSMRLYPFINCVIPKEGTYFTIENLAIPKTSRKADLVYQLINYLYRPEAIKKNNEIFAFFPVIDRPSSLQGMSPDMQEIYKTAVKQLPHFYPMETNLSEKELRILWVDVKG